MIYSDRYRVERIAEIGRQLLDHLERECITSEQILDDYAAQWLVTTPLYNIGEQVYCLSSAFKDAHPRDSLAWYRRPASSPRPRLRRNELESYSRSSLQRLADIHCCCRENFIR